MGTQKAVRDFFKASLSTPSEIVEITVNSKDSVNAPSFAVFQAGSRNWALGDGSGDKLEPRTCSLSQTESQMITYRLFARRREHPNSRSCYSRGSCIHTV